MGARRQLLPKLKSRLCKFLPRTCEARCISTSLTTVWTDAYFASETFIDARFGSHKKNKNGYCQTHLLIPWNIGCFCNVAPPQTTMYGEAHRALQTSYSWTWLPLLGAEGGDKIRKGREWKENGEIQKEGREHWPQNGGLGLSPWNTAASWRHGWLAICASECSHMQRLSWINPGPSLGPGLTHGNLCIKRI